jgi:hypothetical protein
MCAHARRPTAQIPRGEWWDDDEDGPSLGWAEQGSNVGGDRGRDVCPQTSVAIITPNRPARLQQRPGSAHRGTALTQLRRCDDRTPSSSHRSNPAGRVVGRRRPQPPLGWTRDVMGLGWGRFQIVYKKNIFLLSLPAAGNFPRPFVVPPRFSRGVDGGTTRCPPSSVATSTIPVFVVPPLTPRGWNGGTTKEGVRSKVTLDLKTAGADKQERDNRA